MGAAASGAAGGAATGFGLGGPAGAAIGAGIGLASPFIAKGLGSLFGLDEPSDAEKRAAALREASLQRLRDAAEGKTASPAQLAALQQQQRTVSALASMAQKGTVQQQAGNVRAAMQATPEVMAQQGAVAAQTRAAEMANARSQLAAQEMGAANAEADAGRKDREYTQRLVGAGVQGGAAAATDAWLHNPEKPPATPAKRLASMSETPYGATSQAVTVAPAAAAQALTLAAPVTAQAGAAASTAADPKPNSGGLPVAGPGQLNSVAVGSVAPGGSPAAPVMGTNNPYAPKLGAAAAVFPNEPLQLGSPKSQISDPFSNTAPPPASFDALFGGAKKKEAVAPATNTMSRDTAKNALISGYMQHYGVAPNQETTNMLLAQWALETGHGKSMPKNNFGGLTGAAPTSGTANLATVEGYGATARNTTQNFRTYATPEQGAADFVGLLKRRYPSAMDAAAAGDTRGFASLLKKGGYYSGDPEAYRKAVDSLYRHSPPSPVASVARRQGGV